MKKKILKIRIGDAYDKETKKTFPVYADFWEKQDEQGKTYYERTERIYVNEIEVQDDKQQAPLSA